MKYITVVLALFCYVRANSLPDYISELICRKSEPDYRRCILKNIDKARSYIFKGIPELSMPPLDPFELPLMTVDRTLNELISIKAVLKDIKMIGAADTVIDDLKVNPQNSTGELRLTMPWIHLEMHYDVNGQLLIVPLRNKGFFSGNFTDTQMFIKGSLKTFEKDGVDYYRVDKLSIKARVGDGRIDNKADNPNLQFGADLISNFFNGNPRLVMDAINPIFVETAVDLYRVVLDQSLASIPAKEWLPE